MYSAMKIMAINYYYYVLAQFMLTDSVHGEY